MHASRKTCIQCACAGHHVFELGTHVVDAEPWTRLSLSLSLSLSVLSVLSLSLFLSVQRDRAIETEIDRDRETARQKFFTVKTRTNSPLQMAMIKSAFMIFAALGAGSKTSRLRSLLPQAESFCLSLSLYLFFLFFSFSISVC